MNLFKRRQDRSEETVRIFTADYLPALYHQTAQSVGKTRSHNEDSLFALSTVTISSEARHVLGLYMVADGMGGHLNGELASGLAIQTASASLYQHVIEPLRLGQKNFTEDEMREALEQAVQAAQEAVINQINGGGTTLTMALVLNQSLYFAHVGDSRLYLASQAHQLAQLTKDHSLVRRLVDLGQITTKEAEGHPQRNVLFRALGQTEGFKVDIGMVPLDHPVRLLLCSDGLWGLVPDEKLDQLVRHSSPAAQAAKELVDLANSSGGTDNISVVLITIN